MSKIPCYITNSWCTGIVRINKIEKKQSELTDVRENGCKEVAKNYYTIIVVAFCDIDSRWLD